MAEIRSHEIRAQCRAKRKQKKSSRQKEMVPRRVVGQQTTSVAGKRIVIQDSFGGPGGWAEKNASVESRAYRAGGSQVSKKREKVKRMERQTQNNN